MRHFLIAALLFGTVNAHAQSAADSVYRIELIATASPMVNFFRSSKVPGTAGNVALGCGLSLRAMWHPGRLLSVGVLTGVFLLAEDDITVQGGGTPLTYTARLTGFPVQLALSMGTAGLECGLGIGPYIMVSAIDGGGSGPVRGRRYELGMTFFGSYVFPVTERIMVGPELRVLSLRYRGIIAVMPSVSVQFTPLRY